MSNSNNSVNRWASQPVTAGQLDMAKALVFRYKISIQVPSTCGAMSKRLTAVENAIRKGQLRERNARRGYGKVFTSPSGKPFQVAYVDHKFATPAEEEQMKRDNLASWGYTPEQIERYFEAERKAKEAHEDSVSGAEESAVAIQEQALEFNEAQEEALENVTFKYHYTCFKCGCAYGTNTRTHFKKDRFCNECL